MRGAYPKIEAGSLADGSNASVNYPVIIPCILLMEPSEQIRASMHMRHGTRWDAKSNALFQVGARTA
jgi:hypothetical protein